MDLQQVCLDCISHIDALSELRSSAPQKAREELLAIRMKWDRIVKDYRSSDIARVVADAKTKLPDLDSSDARWSHCLADARGTFLFYVHQ